MTLGEYRDLLAQVLAEKIRIRARAPCARAYIVASQAEIDGLILALKLTERSKDYPPPSRYVGKCFDLTWADTVPEPPSGWDDLL